MSVIRGGKCKNCGHDIVLYDSGPPMHVKRTKIENERYEYFPTFECGVPDCHCRGPMI